MLRIFLFVFIVYCKANEVFNEQLLIEPLMDQKLSAYFHFNLKATNQNKTIEHFNLFPKPIGQLVDKYGVKEMHLSFTQGRWKYERWGYLTNPAPVGVQLSVWFKDNGKDVDSRWLGLQQALGGLFSASMHFMRSTLTIQPQHTFRPENYSSFTDVPLDNSFIRYAALPREAVCTENLTPWLKLLPCRRQAGISRLLSNPQLLYDVQFHSMGVHLVSKDVECTHEGCNTELDLSQTLTLVLNPLAKGRNAFNLKSIFGISEILPCPLSSSSRVYVTTPSSGKKYTIHSSLNNDTVATVPPSILEETKSFYIFDLLESPKTPFQLRITFDSSPDDLDQLLPVPITVNRFLTGYGRQKGGITFQLSNHLQIPVEIRILQMVPWYLQLYFHTLVVTKNNVVVPELELFDFENGGMLLTPGEDRVTPSIMEFKFQLDANTTIGIEIEFDKSILHFFEYPPDPNRGFDIGSAVVQVLYKQKECNQLPLLVLPLDILTKNITTNKQTCSITESSQSMYIYTMGLSVMLPTPDFSMPYNVITLTCTVVSFFFGQMVKIFLRRYSETFKGGEQFASNRPIVRLINAILGFIKKQKGDKEKMEEKVEKGEKVDK